MYQHGSQHGVGGPFVQLFQPFPTQVLIKCVAGDAGQSTEDEKDDNDPVAGRIVADVMDRRRRQQ